MEEHNGKNDTLHNKIEKLKRRGFKMQKRQHGFH